jgi:catechol 2,3-dioxygenase-like lactoylglutathione lyase family enzyme
MSDPSLEITGIDHVYIAVADMLRSEGFYDPVMRMLGFKKSSGPLAGGDRHVHYFNRITQFSIRPSREGAPAHDRMSPGLHHVCWRVPGREQVDAAAAGLGRLGVECSAPRLYPEYAPDYYATFFSDPDGIRLEIVNHRQGRRDIAENWDELPWSRENG